MGARRGDAGRRPAGVQAHRPEVGAPTRARAASLQRCRHGPFTRKPPAPAGMVLYQETSLQPRQAWPFTMPPACTARPPDLPAFLSKPSGSRAPAAMQAAGLPVSKRIAPRSGLPRGQGPPASNAAGMALYQEAGLQPWQAWPFTMPPACTARPPDLPAFLFNPVGAAPPRRRRPQACLTPRFAFIASKRQAAPDGLWLSKSQPSPGGVPHAPASSGSHRAPGRAQPQDP